MKTHLPPDGSPHFSFYPICLLACILVSLATMAEGFVMTFQLVTPANSSSIASDLSANVTDLGGGKALVQISKGSSFTGDIDEVYFDVTDSVTLISSMAISNPMIEGGYVVLNGVGYAGGILPNSVTPAHPPGTSTTMAPWQFETDFSFGATSATNRIDNGETAAFIAILSGGKTFADLQQSAVGSDFRIGMHVKALSGGESDAYVSSPPVPEPSCVAVGTIGTLLLLLRRARRA